MKLRITKYQNKEIINWEADCTDLSGSLVIGRAKTKNKAILDLYAYLLFHYDEVKQYIDFSFLEIIDEKGRRIYQTFGKKGNK